MKGEKRKKTREGECVREKEGGRERKKTEKDCVGLHIMTTHVNVRVTISATALSEIYCAAGNLFLMNCRNWSSGPQIQWSENHLPRKVPPFM